MFGKIFGSDKAMGAITDGMDKVWFTDEEKAEFMLKFLKAYEPFKLTQRVLAFLYSVPYVGFGCYGLATRDHQLVTDATMLFGTPASIIVGFYFAGGMIEGAIRAKVEK